MRRLLIGGSPVQGRYPASKANDGSCPEKPVHLTDNGPEVIAQALLDWCEVSTTTSTAYIESGSPWENCFAESFNGRFRDEFFNTELFTTAPQAQLLADRWWEYNTFRPHSALQGRTPWRQLNRELQHESTTHSRKHWTHEGGHVSGAEHLYL